MLTEQRHRAPLHIYLYNPRVHLCTPAYITEYTCTYLFTPTLQAPMHTPTYMHLHIYL